MAAKVLEDNPNLKGYFCTNQVTADDVLEALKEAEREEIAVVGFDAGKTQKEAIKDGREAGVIAQKWIDAASLDDEKLKNYLYE